MKAIHLPASNELLIRGCGDEIVDSVLNDLLMECYFRRVPMKRRVMARYRTYAKNYDEVMDRHEKQETQPHPDELYWNYRVCYKRETLEEMWKHFHKVSWKEYTDSWIAGAPGD